MVSEEKSNLDDVLARFRLFNPYHSQLMLFIVLAYTSNAAYCTNYIFAVEEVKYRCKDDNFINNTCGAINAKWCTEWIYEKPDSFVAEFQLACQDWKRTLVGTVHSFAYMVGLVFIGAFSDRFGRKAAIVATGVIGGLCGLARSFVTSYWWYLALEFLESGFGDICSATFILNIEIIATKHRVSYSLICSLGYVVGGLLKALIAYLVSDWRDYLRVLYAPALLFFFYIYVIDESPRWLLIKGKKEQAIAVVEKMARKNGVKIDQHVLDNLVCEADKEGHVKFLKVLHNTFTSSTLLKRFIVCVVWWITGTFVNYGMAITSVSLQGDKYWNFALVSIISLPATLISMFLLMKYKRKFPLIISFLIAGVFCIGQPFLPTGAGVCTFTSSTLLKRFIACVVWWITGTFVSYGMAITSVSLQGDKYWNFALVSIISLPSTLISMFLLMKYKRKFPLIISFLIAGVFCIEQPFLPADLTWLSIMMFMAGKMMSEVCFGITYLYTSELFPTYTRNSMHALCSSLGRIGSIVAPQLPLLTVYWVGLPSFIFGATSIFAGLITFIIPDLSNATLPDTVKEAEALGSNNADKSLDIPQKHDKNGVKKTYEMTNQLFDWNE